MANLFKTSIYFLRGIFSSGLVPASVELLRAVHEARRKHRKTGHRFYAIWDVGSRHLVTLTFDGYPGRIDSYQHLRHRGAFPPVSRREFIRSAFFYTGSRNGAREMPRTLLLHKLQLLRHKYFCRIPSK